MARRTRVRRFSVSPKIADDYERTYVGGVSFTNWSRRGPIPPGPRSLQKLVNVG
jgi:hypothetical protein